MFDLYLSLDFPGLIRIFLGVTVERIHLVHMYIRSTYSILKTKQIHYINLS